MKYLTILLFCISCIQTSPNHQKMLEKSTRFVKYQERVNKVYIMRNRNTDNLQNGKYFEILSEKEILHKGEYFCTAAFYTDKKRGKSVVNMSFCSGANYAYYFSGEDSLDSMDIIFTKREPNKLDSLCRKIFEKKNPDIIKKVNKYSVPPPNINY